MSLRTTSGLPTLILAAALSWGACGVDQGAGKDEEPNIGAACTPLVAHNALFSNALFGNAMFGNAMFSNAIYANAIFANALYANGMYSNGIYSNALYSNAMFANGLRDPLKRQLLEYTVSCALRPDQEVRVTLDGREMVFKGGLGLAPEWGTPEGRCDATCQGWVSACLIARVNAKGERRLISMRGHHPSLAVSAAETRFFTEPEATYFGNVASRPQRFFACLPDGVEQIPRVCGPDLASCFLDVVGRCSEVCKRGVCRDRAGNTYPQAISVYLPSAEAAERCKR